MPSQIQKIIPNLWFDREAEEAVRFYSLVFTNAKVGQITRASKTGFEITGLSEGAVMTVEMEIEGYRFVALNGGPLFKFNPSISFLVACKTTGEVEKIWNKLSEGGSALMELGEYPHSPKYGWIQDKYGLSWQIMFMADRETNQKITPTLMFVGSQYGKAEAAVNFYTTIFNKYKIDHILHYSQGMEPDKEETVQHAGFTLENQGFAAMDSARVHNFSFNEAISFIVSCESQNEIDYYWNRLTAEGGQEGVCGWLIDRFGVSWQVVPVILNEMLRDSDKARVARVTNAFLKMKKFNIEGLKKAYQGVETF